MKIEPSKKIPTLPRVIEYLEHWAIQSPDSDALVLGDERITYAQLANQVETCARAMVVAGVTHGDRVATLAPPSPDYYVTFLAATSIGAIWCGLNPKYRTEELVWNVGDAQPSLLFSRQVVEGRDYSTDIEAMQAASPSISQVVSLDGGVSGVSWEEFTSRQCPADEYAEHKRICSPDDPAVLVYTSGSTGRPKGAILLNGAIAELSRLQNEIWPVSENRALNYFPINHVGCLIDISTPVLVAGGTTVFMESFDPLDALRLMQDERLTIWGSVPTVFQLMLSLPNLAKFDLSSIELIIWEGAAMPAEMIPALKQICPRMATNYGMTETTSAITIVEPTDDEDVLANTVGSPVPGVDVRLIKEDGSVCGFDEAGEVQTRSRFTTSGYWNRPDATRDVYTEDGYFRTGDLAIQRQDGRYRIVGRLGEMFKSGGYNVYPREVEATIEEHQAVASAAVVSVKDKLWDEVGVAYVTLNQPSEVEEIKDHCRAKLANFKIPKQIEIVEMLPLLPIGKVDKVALRKLAQKQYGEND